jgi:catechol 2,3-dioxygenase-like lactoylglutathione lyase family enzyme
MTLTLSAVTYLVNDYDEAIRWFTQSLGFKLLEDNDMGDGKRWVRVAPTNNGTCFVLAKASCPSQAQAVTNAAGGRVAYFLYTDDFANSRVSMTKAGIRFREEPRHEPYGTVAVFEDLYGNGWDLIGRASKNSG